jgi:integrase
MASLQARHRRSCTIGTQWTSLDQTPKRYEKVDGQLTDKLLGECSCKPMYHVVHRHEGRLVRDPVGQNLREAKRALDARLGDIARREYRVLADIAFGAWADQYLASFTGKEASRRVYATTLTPAKAVFGSRKVRDLGPGDIRRFLDHVRVQHRTRGKQERELSPATQAKHLRHLGACFAMAVSEGYAAENPVKQLHKSARPKVRKSRPVYYTDAELARLWPELAERPVYLALHKVAVTTGLRFGELAALEWDGDVDLLNREVHVRKQYSEGIGIVEMPKDNEERTVDLSPQAASVLEQWFTESGGGKLVFERETGGYLSNGYTRDVLYKALDRAGIPREGESGRLRDFHALRHTFARITLQHGTPIVWVKEQLGHSSITLTVDLYGHWSEAARKAEAQKLAGAFPL